MNFRWRISIIMLSMSMIVQVFAAPLDDAKAAFKNERYAEALSLLEPLANSGVTEAQRMLGEMFYAGKGVAINKALAFNLTESAAIKDDPVAQFSLAYLYEKGDGVAESRSRAIDYYRKAALQNYVPAMIRLANISANNDSDTAKYWYGRAAEYGNEEARVKLDRIGVRQVEASAAYIEKRDRDRASLCESSCSAAHQRTNCRNGFIEPSSCSAESAAAESAGRVDSGSGESARPSNPFAEQAALFAAQSNRISQIHDQGMASIQAQQQQRQRQEQHARENQKEMQRQQQRAEGEKRAVQLADVGSQADALRQRREQEEERAREKSEADRTAQIEQRAQENARRDASAKEQREHEKSEQLAKAKLVKEAENKGVTDYLQALTQQTRLSARSCPGGGFHVVGIRPSVKPRSVECVDVHYRARCEGSPDFVDGIGDNFVGIGTDCYTGDTYPIEPKPKCKIEQVKVSVRNFAVCRK